MYSQKKQACRSGSKLLSATIPERHVFIVWSNACSFVNLEVCF